MHTRAICYRPSVRPSVARMNPTKTVEVRIMKFLPYGSPMTVVFAKFHPEILRGSPEREASNKGGIRKISHFLALSINISKSVADTAEVTIND